MSLMDARLRMPTAAWSRRTEGSLPLINTHISICTMDPKLGNGGEGRDPEKALHSSKSNSSAENAQATYMDEAPKGPWTTRFVDSFRRDPNAAVTKASERAVSGEHGGFDHAAAAEATANSGLSRKLKARHLQMIAIGGSIGTGLFVTSGAALSHGGPASLIIAYGIIGIMLFCTVHALGEMAVAFPVAGSFSAYSTRFLDPAWGFAMGWNYAIQWLVVLPLEIVAASITLGYWPGAADTNSAAWVTIFFVVIVAINFIGVKGYGEAEFIFSIIKVVAVIGFIILGIVLDCGGGPDGENIGALFWRICLFYMVALTLVSVLVPYGDRRLLGSSSTDAKASPFVIAINNARISVLPSIMNVVILISVLSVGNSSIYGSSRTLAALAEQGQAPRFLAYIDREGRPLMAIIVASVFGLLCYVVAGGQETANTALNWLYSLSGLSSLFTWGSICLAHIRFRDAWKKQGHSLSELAFTSQVGVIGSWVGFILNCLVLIAQFWTAIWPIGYASMSGTDIAENFFLAYLAAPVVLLCYIPYKLWYKTPFMRSADIDLVTGRREVDTAELIEAERLEKASWPAWKRVYKTFC
ncbi:Amino acid polyamine transporter I protein [Rutstroemia sp. NJR-2017a BVV2]|nr:Amino acid polyamine transporter I protein [Rutstroemia sp. NJR-2017a BVV2]PQE09360.1 Amino acid polyamine transporter I protein [Rutstroemia sp. NJR-2017a BVV2]